MKAKITLLIILWTSLSFGQIQNGFKINHLQDLYKIKPVNRMQLKNTTELYKKLDSLVSKEWDSSSNTALNYHKDYYEYDANGNIIQATYYLWDDGLNEWKIDNGQQFTYDSENNLSEVIYLQWDNTSNSLLPVYKKQSTYNNSLLSEDVYYSWDESTQVWNQEAKHVYTYDNNEYLTRKEEFFFYNNSWIASSIIDYTNDANGSLLEEIRQNYDFGNNQWFNFYRKVNVYDSNNLLIETTEYDWDQVNNQWVNDYKTEKTYNTNNKLIEVVESEWNTSSNQWVYLDKDEYTYDANQNIVETLYSEWLMNAWEPQEKTEIDYDNTYSLNQLLLPFFMYDYEDIIMFFNHMPVQYRDYEWDGSDWDQDYTFGDIYYSDIDLTNVDRVNTGIVKIFPNPVQEQLNVMLKDNIENAQIAIVDLSGKELMVKNLSNGLNTIRLNRLSKGIYLYRIINGDEIHTGKLIKQ